MWGSRGTKLVPLFLGITPFTNGATLRRASLCSPGMKISGNSGANLGWLIGCVMSVFATMFVPTCGYPQSPAPSDPAKSENPASTSKQPPQKSIREIDLEEYLQDHIGEVDPDFVNLQDQCAKGDDPIRGVTLKYADLDGDGKEEAIFQGFTCLAGNNGYDFFGVLKLNDAGKIVELPVPPFPREFKGRETFENLRGHVHLEVLDGKLAEVYPVYSGDECTNCAAGGDRQLIFRWDGQHFVPDAIIDIPPR
jgi:hypothetical protein